MTATPIPPTTGIADMNGPVAYWGPAGRAATGALLNERERATLLKVRARITDAGGDALPLTTALDTLLAYSSLVRRIAA